MMTQERKDELLKESLRLIGIHLDEDENIVRALSRHLGMSAEEIAECGFAEEYDLKTRFEHRLRECLREYTEQWLAKQPLDLVERSDEISAARDLAADLPDMLNHGEMEYLLRFKNPLEVAMDTWCGSVFSQVSEDEFRQALFEVKERYDLDGMYELTETAIAAKKEGTDRPPQQKNDHRSAESEHKHCAARLSGRRSFMGR